jgi:hypothetical protein
VQNADSARAADTLHMPGTEHRMSRSARVHVLGGIDRSVIALVATTILLIAVVCVYTVSDLT